LTTLFTAIVVALVAITVSVRAEAATTKKTNATPRETSCKVQAAEKYSALHFLKRRAFVKHCMGEKS